jgi:hypothetical protein
MRFPIRIHVLQIVMAVLMAFAGPAAAESARELHIVGIYQGIERTDGRIHGPEANVTLDRPGTSVTLMLGSYGAVRWKLHLTPGTVLERVVVYGGRAARSEVIRDDAPSVSFDVIPDLRYTYQAEGYEFRALIEQAPKRLGFDAVASFSGSYEAPPEGFLIDRIQTTAPELKADPLAQLVIPGDEIPATLTAILEGAAAPADSGYRFTDEGFEVTQADGKTRGYPVNLDVPEISWPMAVAHDPKGQRLFGVSLGGEGYLYQYDIKASVWSVVASMSGFDASGMIYDPAGDRLIVIGGGLIADIGLVVFDLRGNATAVRVGRDSLPGFGDLYDPGNGPAPGLRILGIEGDQILVTTDAAFGRRALSFTGFRTYLIDVRTGAPRLAAYGKSSPTSE